MLVRRLYEPLLEILYDDARLRAGDLDKLEQIAAGYATRERFLSELMLDPPEATGAHAEPPYLDEDRFERQQWPQSVAETIVPLRRAERVDVAARMRDMWR